MIKSMTGYGKAIGEVKGSQVSIEIKSLNSKFLELSFRLSAFRDKEPDLRNWLSKEIERGKADVSLMIENTKEIRRTYFNKELVREYYEELHSLKKELGVESPDYLRIISGMPNVFNTEKSDTDETAYKQLEELFKKAIRAFNEFRLTEGKSLAVDFAARLDALTGSLETIEKLEPARMKAVRKKLKTGLAGLEEIPIEQNRFEPGLN